MAGTGGCEALNHVRSLMRTRGARGLRGCDASEKKPDKDRSQVQFWADVFRRIDTDNSGTLSFEKIRHLVRSNLRVAPRLVSDEELREVFRTLDANNDNCLDWNEWLDYVVQPATPTAKPALPVEEVLLEVERVVRLALRRHGIRPEEVRKIWSKKAEVDGFGPEGSFGAEEVVRFFRRIIKVEKRECPEKYVRIAFESLHRDDSKTVSAQELLDFVARCSSNITIPRVAKAVSPRGGARPPRLLAGTRELLPVRRPTRRPGSMPRDGLLCGLTGLPFCLNGRDVLPSHRTAASGMFPAMACSMRRRLRPTCSAPELPPLDPRGGITANSWAASPPGSAPASPSHAGAGLGLGRASPRAASPVARLGATASAWAGSHPAAGAAGYRVLTGAETLNRVERRLLEAGIDVRGGFHRS